MRPLTLTAAAGLVLLVAATCTWWLVGEDRSRQFAGQFAGQFAKQIQARPTADEPVAFVDSTATEIADPAVAFGVGAVAESGAETTAGQNKTTQTRAECTPGPGVSSSQCGIYHANAWWLPRAYVDNATCFCEQLPDSPVGDCVRSYMQERLARVPQALIDQAVAKKPLDELDTHPVEYELYYIDFVHQFLSPMFYQDLAEAYSTCCCTRPPAPFSTFRAMTVSPLDHCAAPADFLDRTGACHQTSAGTW